MNILFRHTLKLRYSKQVSQTLFVHYIEQFTISNVNCLVNPQNGSWVLFTISQNSLYRGSLYRGLSVLYGKNILFFCFFCTPIYQILKLFSCEF